MHLSTKVASVNKNMDVTNIQTSSHTLDGEKCI